MLDLGEGGRIEVSGRILGAGGVGSVKERLWGGTTMQQLGEGCQLHLLCHAAQAPAAYHAGPSHWTGPRTTGQCCTACRCGVCWIWVRVGGLK